MRPIKVLYDYPSFIQTHGGVSRYVCEIIKELEGKVEAKMSILLTNNNYVRDIPSLKSQLFSINKNFKGKIKLEKYLNTLYSNCKVIGNNYDLYHSTCTDYHYLRKIKKPIVVTIHDMLNEKFPQYHKSREQHIKRKRELIYQSSHIISISESTKKDLLEIYPVNPDKISVIYHAPPKISNVNLRNEYGDYILFVGKREGYKNFTKFIDAAAILLKENPELKLICVGAKFREDEEKMLTIKGIREQVLVITASDEMLYSLYKNALVFVFPSTFEGFGIPILEAFANDCPVCLSNSSCFPEVAGNAAEYFDPEDSQSIYSSVKNVISDKKLRAELIEAGRKRLQLFSWGKAAQQTLEVYQKAC